MVQNDQLVMLGLGSDGSADFAKGIHLRWSFNPGRGWPRYGFELWRREAAQLQYTNFRFKKGTLGAAAAAIPKLPGALPRPSTKPKPGSYTAAQSPITLTSNRPFTYDAATRSLKSSGAGTLTVAAAQPLCGLLIRYVSASGEITCIATDSGIEVAARKQAANNARQKIELRADRFNGATITWSQGIEIIELAWSLVPPSIDITVKDWNKIGSFNLPGDITVAKSRIAYPAVTTTGVDYGNQWPAMQKLIQRAQAGETALSEADGDETRTLSVPPLQLLLMSSLVDTNIARMLGIYHIDTKTDPAKRYDYALVARWSESREQHYVWLCFDLAATKPAPVAAPAGLRVSSKELLGNVYNAASTTTQTGATISWTPSKPYGGKSEHKCAVYYHILRQDDHDGTLSPPSVITKKRPILVSSLGARRAEAGYYIDGPLADGDYRYSIRAYDIFGRASVPSSGVSHTSRDTVAPPPPSNLRAYYHTNTSTLDISWDWLATHMEQAGDADQFDVFVATENVAPLETIVQTAVVSGSSTKVTTDLDPAADYSLYLNGWFVQSGQRLRITAISGGGAVPVALTLASSRAKPISVAAAPSGKRKYLKTIPSADEYQGRALITPDWGDASTWPAAKLTVPISDGVHATSDSGSYLHFSVSITGISMATSRTAPIVNGLAAVATTDKSGNQGRVSPPALFQALHSETPATPGGMLGDPVVYATRADVLGSSYVDLSFTADSDVYYQVLRSTDTALALASGLSDAAAISDDDVLSLANNDSYSTAFTNVGAKNSAGAVLSSNDAVGGIITYKDTIPGTGNCRYVYRIKAVDKAGNASSLSAAVSIVKLVDVTPPAAVVINRVTGGDRAITLTWQSNREPDLAGYYLYRTDDSAKTADIRDMERVATIPKPAAYSASQSHTDEAGITGLTDYYYRVTAYDSSGNESAASAVLTGRAYDTTPPGKPVITASSRASDGQSATIQWTCQADVTCMLQRQSTGGGLKATVAGWSLHGSQNETSGLWEFTATDSGLSPGSTYRYYLTCMSASGMVSETTESEEV